MAGLVQQSLTQTTFGVLRGLQGNWLGAFDKDDHLQLVQGIRNTGEAEWYVPNAIGQLKLAPISTIQLQGVELAWERVRVLGYGRKSQWILDPPVENIEPFWRLWVHENRPLSNSSGI